MWDKLPQSIVLYHCILPMYGGKSKKDIGTLYICVCSCGRDARKRPNIGPQKFLRHLVISSFCGWARSAFIYFLFLLKRNKFISPGVVTIHHTRRRINHSWYDSTGMICFTHIQRYVAMANCRVQNAHIAPATQIHPPIQLLNGYDYMNIIYAVYGCV